MDKVTLAKDLIMLAKSISSDDMGDTGTEETIDDPKFNEKIRELRTLATKLQQKKRRRLQQFGIGLIRPNGTVEDLVDALLKVLNQG